MELIYDVGAHCGSDTAHYLAQGYRVLAIEADPTLAENLRERFAIQISSGYLTVLQCGIAETEGELPFYICPGNTEWNSFKKGWAESRGMPATATTVATRTFGSVLREYGTPVFMKVDIEGLDALCIRALEASKAPRFVSFEAARDDLDLVTHLRSVGYERFALIDQYTFGAVSIPKIGTAAHVKWAAIQLARSFVRAHPSIKKCVTSLRPKLDFSERTGGYRTDSAGPSPMQRAEGWQSIDEFTYTWMSVIKSGLLASSWFDIHAARG